jgi:hypothetical protein
MVERFESVEERTHRLGVTRVQLRREDVVPDALGGLLKPVR